MWEVVTVVVKVCSLADVKVVSLAAWREPLLVACWVECWADARVDLMVDALVAWKGAEMAAKRGLMLAVLSADEWDAKMVASKDALKAGLTVDVKADLRGLSRVVHSAVGLESWLVGLMDASMVANWVALMGALSVVVMEGSKVAWWVTLMVARSVEH